MIKFSKNLILLLLILIAFVLSGCGRKAPPVPPCQIPPSPAGDLSSRIDGDPLEPTCCPAHSSQLIVKAEATIPVYYYELSARRQAFKQFPVLI